jgi:hypothetical protein
MSEEKISPEEFNKLYDEVLELTKGLTEIDRHGRGGTTLGELFASPSFGEGLSSIYSDPLYIENSVNDYLEWWCGERDVWYSSRGRLLKGTWRAPGIAGLGKQNEYGEEVPGPEEIGLRASRAEGMTERKAEHRIAALYEHAKLCLDIAEAFEQRLEDEAWPRPR